MRVRVEYSTTVGDDYRRAIRIFYGKAGLATRAEVQAWLMSYGTSEDDNLMYELEKADREVDALIADLGAA